MINDTARIKVLDGWRVIAAGLVIVSHLAFRSDVAPLLPHARMAIYPWGHLGVLIFFILSGYVITDSLFAEAARECRPPSIRNFMIRRALRIFPPLAFYITGCIVLDWCGIITLNSRDIVKAAAFVCNIWECDEDVSHTATLAYEEQFYILYPFIFVMMLQKSSWMVVFCGCFVLFGVLFAPVGENFFQSFSALSLGVSCRLFRQVLLHVLARVPNHGVLAAFAVLLCYSSVSAKFSEWFGERAAATLGLTVTLVFVAGVIMTSIARAEIFTTLLTRRPLAVLGRATYGIYLWQQITTGQFVGSTPVLNVLLTIIMIPICVAVYLFVESPLIRLGRSLTSTRAGR